MSARLTRRELLHGALAAAAVALAPARRADACGALLPWRNWSGREACVPLLRLGPASEAQVVELLKTGTSLLRPAGAGHSFSALVPTDGALLFLDRLAGVRSADAARLEAEVWAGMRLSQLGSALEAHGQAQQNLPDIDQQTLGGAIATSTHGTGATLGSLSSCVVGLALATPRGELLECDARRNAEVFHAARTSLGALGAVTRVTLANRTAHRLVEKTRWLELDDLLANLTQERDAHRHFEFYAFPHSRVALAIDTNETLAEPYARGEDDPQGVLVLRSLFQWTRRLPGAGGAVYDALLRNQATTERADASWRVLAHPRTVRFNEMEYTVPAESGPACLREVLAEIEARDLDVCFPIECRFVAADDVWLSPFFERPGFAISVHQFAELDPTPYFDAVEPIFWRHGGRPHWGKLHSLDAPRLAELYPRWRDFADVRRALDPGERLVNAHLAKILGVGAAIRT